MPASKSELAPFVERHSPYHFQRSLVQVGSNFPRTAQPGVQPNQLMKQTPQREGDFFVNMAMEFEKQTGIPAFNQPKKFNWRVI